MNFMEMFVVVLAVMLFSTVAIMHQQTMLRAQDQVTNASHMVQSMQLAHEILDEIDARLLISKLDAGLSFSQIAGQYDDTQRHYDLEYYGGVFDLEINVQPCDAYGNTTGDPKLLTNRLVTVLVHGPAGQQADLTMNRIYTPYTVEGL